jgi:DNA primase
MAGRIPPEFIDDLLARTDIVDLIGSRLTLRKAGQNFQALCPFHDEKTASFTVSPEKQFYHCFGCGAHGTAIGFLMEYNHLPFMEAIEELANRLGMELPSSGDLRPPAPDYAPLFHLLEQATALYRQQLRTHPDAPRAVAYLKQRGCTGASAARYQLGFAPTRGNPILIQLGSGDAQICQRLLTAGLVSDKEGQHYDRFRNRIIFPIRDRRGRVVGFGGRALDEGKAKYLNSPETPIFHKGRELYGLWEAQQATRQLTTLLVVEGYFDVIALAQCGITNAVATLGTATTPEHLRLLLRTVSELIFCFDGDRAGRAAALKALETALPLLTGQQSLRFLLLPEGDDPDTLVRREGAAGFTARLALAQPLSEFLFAQLTAQVGELHSTEQRARFANLAQKFIQKVPAGIYRDLLLQQSAELAQIPPAPLLQRGVNSDLLQRGESSHFLQRGESSHFLQRGAEIYQQSPPLKKGGWGDSSPPLKKGGWGDSSPPLKKGGWGDFHRPSRIAQLVALLFDHPELAATVGAIDSAWRRLTEPGLEVLTQMLDLLTAHPEMTKAMLLERWRDHPHFAYLQKLSVAPFLQDLADGDVLAEWNDALTRLSEEVKKSEQLKRFN